MNNENLSRTLKVLLKSLSLTAIMLFVAGFTANASAQSISYDIYGYRANEGGGGGLDTKWTKGNLGNTWSEGEWVPYQMVISNPAGPAFADYDSIIISFDFTRPQSSNYYRFVDLVRDIQVGTDERNDFQGWVAAAGDSFPVTTRGEIEIAQNYPNEHAWTGFTLLNLPNSQVNRKLDGGLDVPPGENRHMFYVKRTDLPVGLQDAPTIVIYFQLHESRTFVWQNSLQENYSINPTTSAWGGYLYGTDGWPASSFLGSGYVPGSSGHIHLENVSGSKDVPIPIPERIPGEVVGLKFLDVNGDSLYDGGDSPLSGWRINVSGEVEGIVFTTSTLTDGSGNYSFPNLTAGTWIVSEDEDREVPSEGGYIQTYTNPFSANVGAGTPTAIADAGKGPWGWSVGLTLDITSQADMNFGNKFCELACTPAPDVTIECDESLDPSNTGYPTIDFNCGPIDTSYSDQVDGSCPATITRTWTFTDDVGNVSICEQTITVQDTVAPEITCPPDTTFECTMGDAGMATATDNCDPDPEVDYVDNVISDHCPTVIERTWTATDSCGNFTTCVQTITIDDTTAPVLNTPPDTTFECVMGDAGTATAIDACDPDPEVGYADSVISDHCPTVIERTWTATDSCGNSTSEVQTITIDDTTAPVLNTPADTTFECVMGDPGTATATDACDPDPEVAYVDTVISDHCPTVIERTWTATDSCGNSTSEVQTITIDDTTAPVLNTPADITFECTMGDPGTATATDTCDPDPEVGYVDNVISDHCPTVIERTWTATDSCGNSTSEVQTITIDDTIAPVLNTPADTTFECVMGDPGTATATDACDPDPEVGYVDNVISDHCPTVIERTWTATDSCGNSTSEVQTITIDDTTAPVLNTPADITFECTMGDAGTATATDTCDPDPEVGYVDNVISSHCPTVIQRTWTATDSCGNSTSEVQTITIDDTTPPQLTCPADVTFDCVMGDPGLPSVWDACDPDPSLDYNDVFVSTSCPVVIERTWTATDSCGNVSTCVQTITIEDTDAPQITCAADETIDCSQEVVFTPPTATDNCDPNPQIIMVYSDTPDGPGTYSRGWIAVDSCGNESDTCYQTITVEPCPCTFTIGGWGTECPDQGDPDWHPGCIRDEFWDDVYPGGSVVIGHPSGYTATWTSSQAVANFLPDGGTPGVLDDDYVDPLETSAGVLASQILALKLNVAYSCAGVFSILGVPSAGDCLGDATIPESCANGLFDGLTVYEFLAIADSVVAGLSVDGLTPSDVNYTATCLNELHSDCDPYAIYGAASDEGNGPLAKPSSLGELPTVFSLDQNYPNPFNPITDIVFGLPVASHVHINIYNVTGQIVATLVDGHLEAGYHTVTWNGSNASSGVYFYKIQAGEFVETRKMLLLK